MMMMIDDVWVSLDDEKCEVRLSSFPMKINGYVANRETTNS